MLPHLAPLFFDIDAEGDLNKALLWARTLVEFFVSHLGLSEPAVRVWFSGSKGAHVLVDPVALGIEPSATLTADMKAVALELVQHLAAQSAGDMTIDRAVYPIGYDIFEGNTFEGKTLIPVLERIVRQYDVGTPVVVADAAMLSHKNLSALARQGYPFIVDARIRNESQEMQESILDRCGGLQNGQCVETEHEHGRLIVAYSDQRAKKDAYNRERGLRRLRKRIRSGRLSKEHLNNRGYNRFLKLTGEVTVELDESKVAQAARWDGLKGYLTNTTLRPDVVIETYGHLWQIERAFRISKTDLRIRPMYHYRRRRIEAHVLVAFVAYAIYKELERRLADAGLPMSPKRAIELCQTMYEMTFTLPNDPQQQRILLKMDPEQQALYDLIY